MAEKHKESIIPDYNEEEEEGTGGIVESAPAKKITHNLLQSGVYSSEAEAVAPPDRLSNFYLKCVDSSFSPLDHFNFIILKSILYYILFNISVLSSSLYSLSILPPNTTQLIHTHKHIHIHAQINR